MPVRYLLEDAAMDSLAWLAQQHLKSVIHREYDWVFAFDDEAAVVVSCLWRLLENGRIRFTSQDEGQKFGLPAPVDAAAELNRRVANATVEAVVLREGTLDLEFRFDTGHILQIIPDSAGYEGWVAHHRDKEFIAVGGGELAILSNRPWPVNWL
jgi:hypothetical protein